MIKGTITSTSLSLTNKGLAAQFEIYYIEDEMPKTITTVPIVINYGVTIATLLRVGGTLSWEKMIGVDISFEKVNNEVIKIANYWDNSAYYSFTENVNQSTHKN